MPTVQDILRQSGFSDSDIERMDNRAIGAFGGVLTAAQEAREAAEIAQKSNVVFYEEKIMPALTGWDEDRERIESARVKAEQQAAYYRSAAVSAGILPDDGSQSRDGQGRYVASAGGSPTFQGSDIDAMTKRAGEAIGILSDIQWKHQSLYGAPLPISPSQLVREADSAGMDPSAFANRKFNFAQREAELEKKRQADHDDAIRREVAAAKDKEWSERTGSNPDVRAAQSSRFADVSKAVRAGQRADPILMNDQQRRSATKQMIREDLSEQS